MTDIQTSGQTPPRLSFSLPLEPSRLLRARHRIRDYLDSHGASPTVIDDVVLAVEEAMTNAVRHSRTAENLEVRLGFLGGDLHAEVRDRGVGFDIERFDPHAVPDPLALDGRGLYLIARLMDAMDLRSDDEGLSVHMRKKDVLGPAHGHAPEREILEADMLAPDLSYRGRRRRTLIEEIAEGFAALDWEYRFIYANDVSLSMYHMEREDVLGRSVWEVFPYLHENELGRALRDAMEFGKPGILDHESPAIQRTLEYRVYPTRAGLSFYTRDITERKRRERERDALVASLAESEERFSAVFENSPYALALSRMPAATLVSVNGAFERLFGYERDEVIGKTSPDLGISDAAAQAGVREMVSAGGAVHGFECERRTKTGERRVLSLSIDPISISGVDHVLTTVQDITTQKRAEEALRRSEARFRRLFDGSPDAVLLTSPDGAIDDANPAACRLLGYTEEELRTLKRDDVLGQSGPRLEAAELTATRKGGKRFSVEVDSVVDEEEATQSFVIMRDISDRKQREDERRWLMHEVSQELKTTRLLLRGVNELNRWTDVNVLLDSLADIALRATGRSRTSVGVLAEDGSSVTVVSTRGEHAPSQAVVPWEGLPDEVREVLGSGRVRIVGGAPSQDRSDDLGPAPAGPTLLVPLVFGEHVLGHIAIDDPDEHRPFTDREVEVVEGIAAAAAAALENVRLFQVQRLRLLHLRTLAKIDELLSSSLETAPLIDRALAAIEEQLGISASTVWRLEAESGLLSIAGVRGFPEQFVHDFAAGVRSDDDRYPAARAAREGHPVVFELLAPGREVGRPVLDAYARYGLSPGSLAALPLVTRGVVVGVLTLAWPEAHAFPNEEISFLSSLAARFANSLENARLFEEQRRIATVLQESLVHPLPSVEGLEIAVTSRPANEPELVGGDFSDVFRMTDGRVAILIGDVAGKGVRAAGLTETVRSNIRAFASIDDDPASILGRTNELLIQHDRQETHVTAFLCILDPRNGQLTATSAGHPAPVHLSPSSSRVLPLRFGAPLNTFPYSYEAVDLTLTLDDYLVLYTDGVTEARRGAELFGEQRLLEVAARLHGHEVAEVAQGVADAALAFGSGLTDDLHVVVVRRSAA